VGGLVRKWTGTKDNLRVRRGPAKPAHGTPHEIRPSLRELLGHSRPPQLAKAPGALTERY